mmetsp:Transcript_33227/g.71226  ORF Transcript_33227/g.71226 Transcript_33227/m.71226 type:complete len:425 (+) Transcript_33227:75-1349(+)
MSLAGGWRVGDRVVYNGRKATVMGGPSRPSCARFSVALHFDDGFTEDARANRLAGIPKASTNDADAAPVAAAGGEQWGLGHRLLPERYCHRPVGGEVAAGYGINSRALPDAEVPKPLGGEVEAGYGIGNRILLDGDQSSNRHKNVRAAPTAGPSLRFAPPQRAMEGAADVYGSTASAAPPAAVAMEPLQVQQPPLPLHPAQKPVSPNGGTPSTQPSQVDMKPQQHAVDAAEAILLEKIYRNYVSLRDAFRALDRSHNGYVTRAEFLESMRRNYLHDGFSEQDLQDLANHFDLNRDGVLSYAEFASILEKSVAHRVDRGKRIERVDILLQLFKSTVEQRHYSISQAFRVMDKDRDCRLSRKEMFNGFASYGVLGTPEELEALWRIFLPPGATGVTLADFSRVIYGGPQVGHHLQRQMFQHPAAVA